MGIYKTFFFLIIAIFTHTYAAASNFALSGELKHFVEPAPSERCSYQSNEPYFLSNPTKSFTAVSSMPYLSMDSDLFTAKLRAHQAHGNIKAIEQMRVDLQIELRKSWFGKKAIRE